MSQEHSASAGSLSVVLQTVRMEIDDDDEDIVEVMLNLTNESAIPIGGIAATIQTSLGATVEPVEGVSSIGPGLTRSFRSRSNSPMATGRSHYLDKANRFHSVHTKRTLSFNKSSPGRLEML